jgi:hypothetical protein
MFHNRAKVCLLRGTDWNFVYQSGSCCPTTCSVDNFQSSVAFLSYWNLIKQRLLHKPQQRPAAYSDTWHCLWSVGIVLRVQQRDGIRFNELQLTRTQSQLCASGWSCTSWHTVRTQSQLCADGVSCTPWHTVRTQPHLWAGGVSCTPYHTVTTQPHLLTGSLSCTPCHIVRTQPHLCAGGVS